MEKKMNNKGFSLVELIIVVAIMAVLIGVLAPAYLQYVEKSKKTSDCSAIGSIMDAIEVAAADPAVAWKAGETVTVKIDNDATSTTGNVVNYSVATDSTVAAAIKAIADPADVNIGGSWAKIEFTAEKTTDGKVTFKIATGSDIKKLDSTSAGFGIDKISATLAARFDE